MTGSQIQSVPALQPMAPHHRLRGYACLIGLAVGLATGTPVLANPQGAQVVHGSVTIQHPDANTLEIHNSQNAIINWQSFSIGAHETTRFVQPSAASAVLNRVVGQDPSQILGTLQSNGRVFLINPNGIVFGAGAVIDTAGLVASTLNMTDQNFLAGNYSFAGETGRIVNQGYIRASQNVYLIAPQIENGGVIETTDGGQVILAAGKQVTLTSWENPTVQFEIQAPEDSVVNLGQIKAGGGAARVFAGTIRHSGEIRADSVRVGDDGTIELVARRELRVESTAVISANGSNGGRIRIESKESDTILLGKVQAKGNDGQGGSVQVLGDRVGLFGEAEIDASGRTGGGEVLVGGDFQGKGEVRTARQTRMTRNAVIRADAGETGDGGKVILWADEHTEAYGNISARGGAQGGNGGFVEVSGKQTLGFDAWVDTTAPLGENGLLLLDPNDLTIVNDSGQNFTDVDGGDGSINFSDGGAATNVSINAASLDRTSNVLLQANQDVIFLADVAINNTGVTLDVQAGRHILVDSGVTVATSGGAISFQTNQGTYASTAGTIDIRGNLDTTLNGQAGADITLDTTANSGTGTVQFGGQINAGTGTVTINSGAGVADTSNGSNGQITAGHLQVTSNGNIALGIGPHEVDQFTATQNGNGSGDHIRLKYKGDIILNRIQNNTTAAGVQDVAITGDSTYCAGLSCAMTIADLISVGDYEDRIILDTGGASGITGSSSTPTHLSANEIHLQTLDGYGGVEGLDASGGSTYLQIKANDTAYNTNLYLGQDSGPGLHGIRVQQYESGANLNIQRLNVAVDNEVRISRALGGNLNVNVSANTGSADLFLEADSGSLAFAATGLVLSGRQVTLISNNDMTLNSLTVRASDNADIEVTGAGGNLTLTGGTTICAGWDGAACASAAASGDPTREIYLAADDITIDNGVSLEAADGRVSFSPTTDTRDIYITANSGITGALVLSPAELNAVSGSTQETFVGSWYLGGSPSSGTLYVGVAGDTVSMLNSSATSFATLSLHHYQLTFANDFDLGDNSLRMRVNADRLTLNGSGKTLLAKTITLESPDNLTLNGLKLLAADEVQVRTDAGNTLTLQGDTTICAGWGGSACDAASGTVDRFVELTADDIDIQTNAGDNVLIEASAGEVRFSTTTQNRDVYITNNSTGLSNALILSAAELARVGANTTELGVGGAGDANGNPPTSGTLYVGRSGETGTLLDSNSMRASRLTGSHYAVQINGRLDFSGAGDGQNADVGFKADGSGQYVDINNDIDTGSGTTYIAGARFASGGTVNLNSTFKAGDALIENGSTVNFNGSTEIATISNPWPDNNSDDDGPYGNGDLTFQGGSSMQGSGTVVVKGKLTLAGTTDLTLDQTLQLDGTGTWSGARIASNTASGTPAGRLIISNGATFDIESDEQIDAEVDVEGTLTKQNSTGTTTFSHVLDNQGGTIHVDSGTLRVDAGISQTDGTLQIDSGTQVQGNVTLDGGILKGNGTITGDLTNNGGSVEPGASPGTLTVDGDFTQGSGGTLVAELGGTGVNDYDVLKVGGTANLGGTLKVVSYNDFSPGDGSSFTVVDAGGYSGSFASVTHSLGDGYSTSFSGGKANISYSDPNAASSSTETQAAQDTATTEVLTITSQAEQTVTTTTTDTGSTQDSGTGAADTGGDDAALGDIEPSTDATADDESGSDPVQDDGNSDNGMEIGDDDSAADGESGSEDTGSGATDDDNGDGEAGTDTGEDNTSASDEEATGDDASESSDQDSDSGDDGQSAGKDSGDDTEGTDEADSSDSQEEEAYDDDEEEEEDSGEADTGEGGDQEEDNEDDKREIKVCK
jgi:filamentous hemagglutinin family protein